jgi:hypothetical protein
MAAMLQKILAHMSGHSDVWFATGSQIADWVIERRFDDARYSDRFFS